MSLRVIFAGTPEFAVPSLQALLDSAHDVVAVYTQPDRPAGRGRQVQISPVKALARDHSCTILQPRSLDQQSERLSVLAPDVLIVVAYGLILPAPVLDIPPLGCLNVHASLLPRWRGAAPIQRAIEAGDTETGISLMRMDPGLDTGDVLLRVPEAITAADTSQSLHDRLALLGAQNLVPGLERWSRGELVPEPQAQDQATYAKKVNKGEADIDWSQDAELILRRIRALVPWPVAQCHIDSQTFKIWSAHAVEHNKKSEPGSILSVDASGIAVAAAGGAVVFDRLQRSGRKILTAAEFLNGYPLQPGQSFSVKRSGV